MQRESRNGKLHHTTFYLWCLVCLIKISFDPNVMPISRFLMIYNNFFYMMDVVENLEIDISGSTDLINNGRLIKH